MGQFEQTFGRALAVEKQDAYKAEADLTATVLKQYLRQVSRQGDLLDAMGEQQLAKEIAKGGL